MVLGTDSIVLTYGVLLVGLIFAILFQGALAVQVIAYFNLFKKDRLQMKLLVPALWLMCIIHMISVVHTFYNYVITNFGIASAMLGIFYEVAVHYIMTGLVVFTSQVFFLYRLWLLTEGKAYLMPILGLAVTVNAAMYFVIAAKGLSNPMIVTTLYENAEVDTVVAWAIGAALDIIITISLVVYLSKFSSRATNARNVLRTLTLYAIGTGIVTSIVSLACLIALVVSPITFVYFAISINLTPIYANAVLASLNGRASLRRSSSRFSNVPSNTSGSSGSPIMKRPLSFAPSVSQARRLSVMSDAQSEHEKREWSRGTTASPSPVEEKVEVKQKDGGAPPRTEREADVEAQNPLEVIEVDVPEAELTSATRSPGDIV